MILRKNAKNASTKVSMNGEFPMYFNLIHRSS